MIRFCWLKKICIYLPTENQSNNSVVDIIKSHRPHGNGGTVCLKYTGTTTFQGAWWDGVFPWERFGLLPNRLELSFLIVLALPNASRIGFACSTLFSTLPTLPALWARYAKHCFVASVLPAPDSPLRKCVQACFWRS